MQLTNAEAQTIKNIYDNFYSGVWNAEEALEKLERLINEQDEE